MVQGCVPVYRTRGRQRRRWTDDITEWTGMKINEAAAAAEDRDRWRGILRAANHKMEDGTRRRRRRLCVCLHFFCVLLIIFGSFINKK